MTHIRIADGDSRDALVLLNERELYRRVAAATAADMGKEAATVGFSLGANPFRSTHPLWAKWQDAFIEQRAALGYPSFKDLAGEEMKLDAADPQPQGWLEWLCEKLFGPTERHG